MRLKKLVVHNLLKELNEMESKIVLSQELMPINALSHLLVSRLVDTYSNTSPTYAVFDSAEKPFAKAFRLFFENNTEENFLLFSQNTAKLLRREVEREMFAKGGYLVFTEYEEGDEEDEEAIITYFSIFLIRDTKEILFQWVENEPSPQINTQEILNLNKLAMACRIRGDNYEQREGKYLTMIKRGLPDISAYFIRWISAGEKENSETYTNNLLNLINLADLPLGEDNVELTVDDFINEVVDHIKRTPGKKVDLYNLSRTFYPREKYLENYLVNLAERNNIMIGSEFVADGRTLNRLNHINVKYGDLQIKFPRKFYKDGKVEVTGLNNENIIIHSSELAKKVLEEVGRV